MQVVLANSLVDNIAFQQGGTTVVTANKAHDAWNRLTSISSTSAASGTSSFAYGYNAAGQRSQATLESADHWDYGYNGRGEVTGGTKKLSGGTDITGYQFGYSFDNIGNRITATRNGRTSTYTPNSVNEYDSRTVPSFADVIGKANATTTVNVNGQAATRQGTAYFAELTAANSSDPVYLATTVTGTLAGQTATRQGKLFVPKTPEAFTYDSDGNLTSDGRWTYTWDAENQLIGQETTAGAASAGTPKQRLTSFYDSIGRRIGKKVESWNGTAYVTHHTLLYVYDGWNLAAEVLAGSGQKIRSYVWGSDLSGGQKAGGVGGLLFIEQQPENKVFSVGYDGNGNVCRLHDMSNSGALAATYEYGPFGELVTESGAYAHINPIRWSTKYQDSESGLVYYGHRFLNSQTRRWISRDPIGEKGGMNLYGFNYNSPLIHIDPRGLTPIGKGCCNESEVDKIAAEYSRKASAKTQADPFGREFGGLVCCKNGKVKATEPHPGPIPKRTELPSGRIETSGVTIDPHVDQSNNPGKVVSCSSLFWLPGAIEVAVYHSHPENSPFSDADKGYSDRTGEPFYNGTPDGNVERADPDPNFPKSHFNGPIKSVP